MPIHEQLYRGWKALTWPPKIATSYQYTALEENEIRLCRVKERRTPTGHIAIELKHFSKSLFHYGDNGNQQSPLEYTALSYTWGSPTPTFQVYVDDAPFEIRPNLHDFLTTLYDMREYDTWLWIDQLSIDQSNVTERNHEVQRMDQIFRTAANVRVWLGLADEDTCPAFALLEKYMVLQKPLDESLIARRRFGYHAPQAWYDKFTEASRKIAVLHERAHVLTCIFGRPYWTRLWVVQEIRVARLVVVQCGLMTLTGCWSYEDRIQGIEDHVHRLSGLGTAIEHWMKAENRQHFPGGDFFSRHLADRAAKEEFTCLVLNKYTGDCFDVRDKVFALMGIVYPRERIVIDYSMSVTEVFWATVDTVFHHLYSKTLTFWSVRTLFTLAIRMGLLNRLGPWEEAMLSSGDICVHDVWESLKHAYKKKDRAWPPEGHPDSDRSFVHATLNKPGCICEEPSYQPRFKGGVGRAAVS